MDALFTSVIRLHEQGTANKKIAKQLKISEQKVRKILITAGAWSSPLSVKIQELHKNGKSIDEIAEQIGLTRNSVLSYLPYDRGMKNAEYPSKNALKIRACRARKQIISKNNP